MAEQQLLQVLPDEDYKVLQLADHFFNGEVARVLNQQGVARFTVCPRCHVDDFIHIEGCELIPKLTQF